MTSPKKYIIYKISNNKNFTYVGMTTQSLGSRFRQHKADSGGGCSVTSKLCQKKAPPDLKALHRRLRDDSTKYRITKLKEVYGSYSSAHNEELKLKRNLSSV